MTLLRSLIVSAVVLLTLCPAQAQPVYFTDFYQFDSIRRADAVTGTALPPPVDAGIILPSSLAYGPDGMLYASNQAVPPSTSIPTGIPGTITKINPATGHVISTISFSTTVNPGGLAFGPNGDLYVSNFVDQGTPGTGTVQKYSISGTVATPVGAPVASGLNQPGGMLFNGSTLYFTETNTSTFSGGRLSKVDFSGATPVTTLGLVTGAPGTGFAGLALSGTTLYYTDLLGGAVDRYNVGTNTALSALVAPGGSLNNQFPDGLYVDSPTSILVADLGGHDPTGPGDPGTGALRRYSTILTDTQIGPDIVSNIYGSAVINAVPEPGTLLLVGGAAIAGAFARRRRKS
jgi:hypothetical protein